MTRSKDSAPSLLSAAHLSTTASFCTFSHQRSFWRIAVERAFIFFTTAIEGATTVASEFQWTELDLSVCLCIFGQEL